MKKLSTLLLATLLGLSLVACSSNNEGEKPQPTETPVVSEVKGEVYYLNFKPEQDAQWKELAAHYEKETGVPVTVVTAASGTYESTFKAEMGKSHQPTLFQVNGPVGLQGSKQYAYDLSNTNVYKNLSSEDFALKEDGQVLGVAYVIESYGLITNTKLLKEAGYEVTDITNFDSLKKVAEDITARSEELGFSAFTSTGMDPSSDWRFKTHLANLPLYYEYKADGIGSTDAVKGSYLDQYKNIFDLYINNSTVKPEVLSTKTGEDSTAEFLLEEAVFYQNGVWAYGDVAELGDENLAMLPIYIGVEGEEKQGLATGTENFWVVNKDAGQENIDATLAFLDWVTTDEVAVKAMCGGEGAMPSGEMGMNFVTPFKSNLESTNVFVNNANSYIKEGKYPVSWNFPTMPSEEWKNGVGSALTTYAAGTTPWDDVVTAFVDGWAKEVAAVKAKSE